MKKFYSYFIKNFKLRIVVSMILVVFVAAGIVAQTPVVSNFSNFAYTERTEPVLAAPSITINGGTSYTDGFLRFAITASTGTEKLGLNSNADPTASGAISLDGISVYLGQGGGSKIRIGEIDATENGQNGNPLKVNITFTRTFPNAGFEDGIGGWTVSNQLYYRQNELNGMEIPIRTIEACGYTSGLVRIASSPTNTSYQVTQTTDQFPTEGSYCIRLYNNGTVPSAYGANCRESAYSIFGPSIVSEIFSSFTGDIFSVDWKAAAGGDWYDVVGYLLGYGSDNTWGTADDSRVQMFAQRGSISPWTTSQITIPSDGEYKFEFVSGSYDRTGGTVLGATLYVDNLQLISGAVVGVDDATIQNIARQVTYHNSTCEPAASQTLSVSAKNTAGNTGTTSASASITMVNCPPAITASSINPAYVENAPAVLLYSNASVTNIETGQAITDFIYTASGLINSTDEKVFVDGTTFSLTDGTGGTTANNSLTYSVSVVGSTASVNFNKGPGISASELKLIIEQMTYSNTSDNPDAGNRIITITYAKDNGGTNNGGADESNLNVLSTVTVKPAAIISIFSGNSQSQGVTSILSNFVVQITTSDGIPVSGRTVNFGLGTGPVDAIGQTITVNSVTTDSEGNAITQLTLGNKIGNYSVSATSTGLTGSPLTFSATGTPLAVDPDNSNVTASGTEYSAGSPVTITISPRDLYNNLVGSGKTIIVKLDGIATDYDGPITITDNGNGTYSAAVRVTNTSAINKITASADGVDLSTSYIITVNTGAAHDFVVTGVITPHIYGQEQTVIVATHDQYQNTKTDYTGTITFSNTDADAQNPSDYTFLISDAGVKSFTNQILFGKAGTFTLTVEENGNPLITGEQTGIIVNKETLTVTADNKSKIYGEANPVLTFQYSGWVNDVEAIDVAPSITTTVDGTTIVGTYTDAITLSGGLDNNYTFSFVSGGIDVTKAVLTATAEPKTKVYGEANPLLTFLYSGWVNGVETIDGAPSITTTVDGTTIVGTYTDAITLSGGSDNNYTFSFVSGALDVTKAILTATPEPKTKVYGEANPLLTFLYSGWVNGVETIDAAPSITTTVDGTTIVGTYTDAITLSGGSDNNYTFSFVSGDMDVTKAILTATAEPKTKVYGETNPLLTFLYSGWLNGVETIDAAPSITTTVDGTTIVGTYTDAITLSGGSDNNYTFSFVSGALDVTKAILTATPEPKTKVYGEANPLLTFLYSGWVNGVETIDAAPSTTTTVDGTTIVGTYTDAITLSGGSDNNYTFSFVSGALDVTKAVLTATAEPKTKVYGEANPLLTFLYSGWLNGVETIDAAPLAATTVDGTTIVGTYTDAITLSGGSDNNYTFSFVSGALDVTKAVLTATAEPKTKVYGEANPLLTFLYSGWLNGVETIDAAPSITTTVDGTTIVGTYTDAITLSGGSDNNYTFSFVAGALDVTKAILTATAEPKTKVYGEANPLLTFLYSGWINGVETIDGPPSITTTVDGTTNVGTYTDAITLTGGSDNNYTFSFVAGDMDVNKAILTATAEPKTKVYGSDNPALTISWAGFRNNDEVSVINELPLILTLALKTSDIGIYDITITGGNDNNYDLNLVNGSLDIDKAPLVIMAEDKAKIYLEPNPELTFTWSGFVLDQNQDIIDVVPALGTIANENSDAGTYDITASGGVDGNYSFTYEKGTLTVDKADQVITFEEIPAGLRMTQELQLNAEATSSLLISFESSDLIIGSIDGDLLTVNKEGNLTITASQTGNHNWNPAPDVSREIVTLPTFDNINSLFTPNNDGMNDFWYIPDIEKYGQLQVTVYNRFGQKVYASYGYKNDWDGTWNGYPLPSASYYYIMKSSTKGFIKGVVNLVR